jgi:hypothetical protein
VDARIAFVADGWLKTNDEGSKPAGSGVMLTSLAIPVAA